MSSVLRIVGTLLVGLLLTPPPAAAQSLADVAKKEQARREALREAGKVYTNADLSADPAGGPETPGTPVSAAAETDEAGAPDSSAESTETASSDATAAEPENTLDESFWRRQARARRARVDDARKGLEGLSGPSEGNEQQQAKMAKVIASAEAVLARAEAALAAFESQARAQGVPEEWIR